MSGGGEEVLDDIALFEVRSLDPAAPAPLAPVGIERYGLHITIARHRHHQVVVGDQILDIELALIGNEPAAPFVGVLVPNLFELGGDDRPNSLWVGEDRLEFRDRELERGVLLADLALLERSESSQRHIENV